MTPFVPIAHDGGLAQEVVASRAAQYITDTGTDPMANPSLAAAGILSYLGVPVKNEERLAGVLFMHSTRSHAFQKDTKDMEFLESLSRVLAGTLLRAELRAQVEAAKVS